MMSSGQPHCKAYTRSIARYISQTARLSQRTYFRQRAKTESKDQGQDAYEYVTDAPPNPELMLIIGLQSSQSGSKARLSWVRTYKDLDDSEAVREQRQETGAKE